MRKLTFTLLLCAGTALGGMLTACQPAAENSNGLSSSSHESIYSAENIKAITNGVADWQIEHMDSWQPWVPSFQDRTTEKRGWIQGTFFKGLVDWAEQTDNNGYYEFLKDFASEQGYRLEDRLYHADDHVVGQYYLALYDKYKDPAMIKPTQDVLDQVLANPSEVSLDFANDGVREGYYRECLERWCWADALFMAPPVLTKLSKITGDPRYLEFSDKEFWITTDYLFDKDTGLFLRDSRFFERREETGEKIFWSRGNGWVLGGLADVMDDLPKNHPSYARYVDIYRQMAAALIKVQAENGYWPVSLTAGHLYPVKESSGTAFFVGGLSWGVANGILDADEYMPSIKKGWAALNDAVTDDGMIGWVQQVGYAPDKVAPNETQFYGAGAFLLAGTGMLELAEKGLLD